MTTKRRDVLLSSSVLAAGSARTAVAETRSGAEVDAPKADSGLEPLCLTDFEPLAVAKIAPMGWEYMTGQKVTLILVRIIRSVHSERRICRALGLADQQFVPELPVEAPAVAILPMTRRLCSSRL